MAPPVCALAFRNHVWWPLLNGPSRVQVSRKRLIQLQDFGRWEYGIHCVGDRLFRCFGLGSRGRDSLLFLLSQLVRTV
jgi:hypothetical protein